MSLGLIQGLHTEAVFMQEWRQSGECSNEQIVLVSLLVEGGQMEKLLDMQGRG